MSHRFSALGEEFREKRVSAQAKPISEVVKEFEHPLETLRPPPDGSAWRAPKRNQSRRLGTLAAPFGWRTIEPAARDPVRQLRRGRSRWKSLSKGL